MLAHVSFNKYPNTDSVAVGAVTGATAAAISCPMEVATVRMSNDATLPLNERRNYKGVFDVVKRISTEEGVSALWRGVVPFAQRAALVGVFQVATLDQFKELYAHQFNQKKGSIPNVFCSAMTSGLIYSIATMPLEASKNRMASQKADVVTGKLPYTSTLQTMKSVSANEGFLALYNGKLKYPLLMFYDFMSPTLSISLCHSFRFRAVLHSLWRAYCGTVYRCTIVDRSVQQYPALDSVEVR